MMYPVINQTPELNATEGSLWDRFASVPKAIDAKLPSFDKSLDAYFDRHFAEIIDEWELVTVTDLHKLETRLERVTDDISALYAGKVNIEARVSALDSLIKSLEAQK